MLRFALPALLAVLALAAACGEAEEDLPNPSPTPEPSPASPSATEAITPSAVPSPAIPADWQTYVDPKGRFTVRVPPDWEPAEYSTEDYPAWLRLDSPQKDSEIADGAKLEIAVIPKQPGEVIEDKAPTQGYYPRLSLEHITLNGVAGIRQTRGLDAKQPSSVGYVFERGGDWIAVNLSVGGPRASEYTTAFDSQIVKTFELP